MSAGGHQVAAPLRFGHPLLLMAQISRSLTRTTLRLLFRTTGLTSEDGDFTNPVGAQIRTGTIQKRHSDRCAGIPQLPNTQRAAHVS